MQLWGQAVTEYDESFRFTFTPEEDEMISDYRENFMHTDELEDELEELVNGKWKDKTFITADDIEYEFRVSLATDRKTSNRISNVMINRFGYRKGRMQINGVRKRGYIRGNEK